LNWFAIQCRALYESRVSDRLRDLSITEFWPNYPVKSRWSDRNVVLARPLFPCYVFGQFDLISDWAAIMRLPGVVRILGTYIEPQSISDSEILNVRRLMASPELLLPCPFLTAGDLVRIEKGPWTGVEGIAIRTKQGGVRVVVSVKAIGASCSVEIDSSSITKLSKPSPLGASRVQTSPHLSR
jgi:transcription antitermination factor NusG